MLGLWGKGGFKQYWKETIMLYDEMFASSKARRRSEYTRKIESEPQTLGVDFLGSYDGDRVTFYYVITGYPRNMGNDYREKVREHCKEGVRVNFIEVAVPHSIEWGSQSMVSKLRSLSESNETTSNKDITVYNLHSNIADMDKSRWIEDSLSYLAVADKRRSRALLKSSVLVTVTGEKGKDFDDSIEGIEWMSKQSGVKLHRVMYDIQDVLSYFSPFSRIPRNGVERRVPSQVLTDEISSQFSVYTQGKIGTTGIYWGTDVYGRFPVMKKVKPKDDSAENWLIMAVTGGGKSHLIKTIDLQIEARGDFIITIMDIEGFEYEPLVNMLSNGSKVVTVNLAEGSGNYVDTVQIPSLTGVEEVDSKMKEISSDFTISTFRTLLRGEYEKDTWYSTILDDALTAVYDHAGVTEDPETWGNSEGYYYVDVYYMMKHLLAKGSEYTKDEQQISCLRKAIALCRPYFEGTRRSVFANRIALEDVITAKTVRCSFGMAGKSQDTVDEVQMSLMQIGAAQISYLRTVYAWATGLFNFKIWEEFQRWGLFPGSEKTIGVALTGGRKMGDVNAIIINEPEMILENDRFNILNTITSFCIGAIPDSRTRHKLCDRLGIMNMLPELDAIYADSGTADEEDSDDKDTVKNNADAAKETDNEFQDDETLKNAHKQMEDAPLKYAFLFGLDRNKFGVLKVVLPEDIVESAILKTGVDKTKQERTNIQMRRSGS